MISYLVMYASKSELTKYVRTKIFTLTKKRKKRKPLPIQKIGGGSKRHGGHDCAGIGSNSHHQKTDVYKKDIGGGGGMI